MKLRIFCDFDGTVALNDVGNLLFTSFGDADHWWNLVEDWRERRVDARALWRAQAAVSRITPEILRSFCASQPIDPHFSNFVAFCNEYHFPVSIISDGMDLYIQHILEQHGMEDVKYYANRLILRENGDVRVEFPHYQSGCKICANCKGYQIALHTRKGETSVFVGDGYSDLCAVDRADIVFAKNDLLVYCRDKNVVCRPFDNFADVQHGLLEILAETN